jgi:hypothetical protein
MPHRPRARRVLLAAFCLLCTAQTRPAPLILNAGASRVWTLRSGLKVELLGLTVDGATWWGPDGQPLDGPPSELTGQRAKEQKLIVGSGEQLVRVAWKVSGWSTVVPGISVSVDGVQTASGARADQGAWEGVSVARLPQNQTTATVRINLAPSPWKPLIQSDGTSPQAQGDSTMSMAMDRAGHAAVAVATPVGGTIVERKLDAIDKAGKTHAHESTTTAAVDTHQMIIYEFHDLSVDAIAKLVLSVRPYDQWVEVRNVRLQPGAQAPGTVEVLSSDKEK